jgi:hypothetical protein
MRVVHKRVAFMAVVALAIASTASASNTSRTVACSGCAWEFAASGPMASFTSTSVVVGSSRCARNASSPGRFGIALGASVEIVCEDGVLISLNPLSGAKFSMMGPIVSLKKISSCPSTADSPRIAGLHVGEIVTRVCTRIGSREVLSGISAGTDTYLDRMATVFPATAPSAHSRPHLGRLPILQAGTHARVKELSVSFMTTGTMRCSVDPGSPDLTSYRLGELVTMICQGGSGSLVRVKP